MITPSSIDLAPGAAFGGYVVRELIGRGGMARVYRAEHLLLNKPVALKVMERALLLDGAARQRFLMEGRAAAAIKHPNVVDITDVGVQDGVPYLVMELLNGEDLEEHLRKRTLLDDGSTIRLALPVIAALHTAHTSGIVHRDIKPSNIFMSIGPDDQFVPKVLDFGISKVSFDNAARELLTTPEHQLIGTPRYLPPEALHGARELGPLSDQYSLGVVLYQCVTGCTPFSGDTLISLLNSLSRGTFEPPRTIQPAVSVGLERIIMRALSAEPSDRFPNIREMGRALLELAAERTQLVWGQSFRALSTPLDAPRLRGDEPPVSPPRVTERLSIGVRRPWRMTAIGLLLLLTGALTPLIWSWLAARYLRSTTDSTAGPTAVRQSNEVARSAPSPPSAPAEEKPEATLVLGLTAHPPDVATVPASRESAPVRARAPRAVARRPSTTPARRSEPRASESIDAPPAARAKEEPAPVDAARVAAPSEPPSRPRLGANRSPLLD